VRRPCDHCGKDFEVLRSELARNGHRFCSQACCGSAFSGARGTRYRGGLYQTAGRWYIKCRDGADVAYYRAVMEAALGRALLPDEHVHHINGDPSDDRQENLMVLSCSEHMRLHRQQARQGVAA
jgi:hypothetical protein